MNPAHRHGETVAAVATPFGEGAVAVVRLSGPEAIAVAGRVFRGAQPVERLEAGRQVLGRAVTDEGESIDTVLICVRRGPASYTGEDLVEFSCHGGVRVTRRLLARLLEAGAAPAPPGEFTRRAFVNGRMDLTQAEAVLDLIQARTDLAARAAAAQLEGGLGRRVEAVREDVLQALAHLEAYIDFPEEGINPDTGERLRARFASARENIAALLRTAGRGRALREGVRTVIAGAPNVGKSSLLNRLLGYDRAIVSDSPGTTRDTIEEIIDLRGVPVRLVDTAGLRMGNDPVEREGIERARRHIDQADLVLWVFDGSLPPAEHPLPDAPRTLRVLNKADLGLHPAWADAEGLPVSCLTGAGFERLEEAIAEAVGIEAGGVGEALLAVNARHQAALQRAAAGLKSADEGVATGLAPEFVAVEVRDALEALGEILGAAGDEAVLDRIFSQFCIGK